MTKIIRRAGRDHTFEIKHPNNFITGKQFFRTSGCMGFIVFEN